MGLYRSRIEFLVMFEVVYKENVPQKWWIKKKLKRGNHKSGTYEGIYIFKVDKETISSSLSCV